MSGQERACCHCGTDEMELRPYGPGGAWVCFPCAFESPEREAQTKGAFGALLEGASAASPHGVAVIDARDPKGNAGPQPLMLPSDPNERAVQA